MPQSKLTQDQSHALLAAIGLRKDDAMVAVGVEVLGGPDVIFVYVFEKLRFRPIETFAGLPVIVEIGVGRVVAQAA